MAVQNKNVAQIAIAFGVIQTVAHHEFVRNAKADAGYVDGPLASVGLIQQSGDANEAGLALLQEMDFGGDANCLPNPVTRLPAVRLGRFEPAAGGAVRGAWALSPREIH